MKFDELLEQLDKLNLSTNDYVIVGSGPLAVRGIREAQDLDILTIDLLWEELSKKYPVKKESIETIEVGALSFLGKDSAFRKPDIATIEEMIKSADIIDNHPYLNLELLKRFKIKLGRDKDLKDIELINSYQRGSLQSINQ